jgi:hypothetical protein
MLWNFATICTFVAVLGSNLVVLMTDREVGLHSGERTDGMSGGPSLKP